MLLNKLRLVMLDEVGHAKTKTGVRPAILRSKKVDKPEQYRYSGHRAYLGLEPAGIVEEIQRECVD